MKLPRKVFNLGLLVIGFGLGQGALFAANTLLFVGEHFKLVAEFGAANAFVTFAYFICDWGGLVYIAKESVVKARDHHPLGATFLALGLVRSCVALVLVAALYIQQLGEPTSLFNEYVWYASLGLFAYAFNANGLLDGASRAGIAGLTQAVPVVGVAITLPFCATLEASLAGLLLGVVYAIGMIVYVALQLYLAKLEWRSSLRGVSFQLLITVCRDSLPYMLTPLPGQVMFRCQVFLATTLLSPHLAALFIYARQIVGVGYQGLTFLLRVDLKDFAGLFENSRPDVNVILLNSFVVRSGVIGTALLISISLFINGSNLGLFHALMIYSPCVFANSVALTLQRAFIVQGRSAENVKILVFSTIVPFVVMLPIVDRFSIWPLVAVELLNQSIQSAIYMVRWKK